MKLDPALIDRFKIRQTAELLKAYYASNRASDLDKDLASAQERLTKALDLVDRDQVQRLGAPHCFIVDKYMVHEESGVVRCSCPEGYQIGLHCQCDDHRHRKIRCKHILAAGLFWASIEKEGKKEK